MDKDQITALAREYAEEKYPYLSDKIISLRTLEIKNAERLIRFLLRRYCLVAKSKVMQIYQAKQHILANQDVFGMTGATEAATQKRLMLYLFPEIGKEVEDERM